MKTSCNIGGIAHNRLRTGATAPHAASANLSACLRLATAPARSSAANQNVAAIVLLRRHPCWNIESYESYRLGDWLIGPPFKPQFSLSPGSMWPSTRCRGSAGPNSWRRRLCLARSRQRRSWSMRLIRLGYSRRPSCFRARSSLTGSLCSGSSLSPGALALSWQLLQPSFCCAERENGPSWMPIPGWRGEQFSSDLRQQVGYISSTCK
jgi:hypothetical protein